MAHGGTASGIAQFALGFRTRGQEIKKERREEALLKVKQDLAAAQLAGFRDQRDVRKFEMRKFLAEEAKLKAEEAAAEGVAKERIRQQRVKNLQAAMTSAEKRIAEAEKGGNELAIEEAQTFANGIARELNKALSIPVRKATLEPLPLEGKDDPTSVASEALSVAGGLSGGIAEEVLGQPAGSLGRRAGSAAALAGGALRGDPTETLASAILGRKFPGGGFTESDKKKALVQARKTIGGLPKEALNLLFQVSVPGAVTRVGRFTGKAIGSAFDFLIPANVFGENAKPKGGPPSAADLLKRNRTSQP